MASLFVNAMAKANIFSVMVIIDFALYSYRAEYLLIWKYVMNVRILWAVYSVWKY